MNPKSILTTFQRSANVLMMNLDGITHAQSLWTPAPNVNSINWLVGHLVSSRTTGLKALGQTPVWDDAIRARYRAGSTPINADGEGVLDLSRLLADFAEAQRRMEAGLEAISAEALDAPSAFEQFASIGDQLLYLQNHEINHVGNIMTMRELLGLPSHWA
jgi:hypothetical protein